MKGFLYGCIITALLIFGINFKNGFMADLTYQKIFSASETTAAFCVLSNPLRSTLKSFNLVMGSIEQFL